MTKFKLGQRVRGGPELIRRRGRYWTWVPMHSPFDDLVEGAYMGRRSFQQGEKVYDNEGCHLVESGPRIKVALIVTDPRKNPVPVLYDSLEGK